MSDDNTDTDIPIPRTLETPPRSTGNAQQDYPVLVDYIYRTYQVIKESVDYINAQISGGDIDFDTSNLPNPETSTVAQAQKTANEAFILASQAKDTAEAAQTNVTSLTSTVTALQTSLNDFIASFVSGTVNIADANTSATVNFGVAQPDTNYRVIIQPISVVASPASGAFTIRTKTYGTSSFSFTIVAAPGVGNTVTYEWQLVRN